MYGYHKRADSVANDLARAWVNSANYINDEMTSIFRTFKLDGGLTEEEAKQLLNNLPDKAKLTDLKAVINAVDDPQKKRELLNVINSPAYAWRIERLERLQQDIDAQTSQLAGTELSTTREHYIELANEAYHRTMFDLQHGTGYGFSFSKMPKQRIAEILNNNWSGKLFSERIWGRAAEVNKEIKHALLTGFMTGRSYRKTAKEIEERMAVGAMEARRLVRTESTYIANMAELESYKEGGVDKFRFLATLDMRTSAICASMDGKVFLTKDGVPGVNIPPLHPWCRSTTVPEIDGADLSAMKRRARDPKTGETYLVPGDMTYEEWRKSVDNSGKSDIIKAEPASIYVNSSDALFSNAKQIKPIANYEDMVIHGDNKGFEIQDKEGNTASQYTPKEFADILLSDPNYHGGNVRLISCEAGKGETCAAQMLANALGVDVMAPTDIVWVFPDGNIIIGKTEFENTGEWKTFKPQKR